MSEQVPSLDEPEKVLVLADITERRRVQLDEENASWLVFLLKAEFEIPFFYRFTFNPMPYSEELMADVATLHEAGYLETKSPIALEQKGRQWIDANRERFQPFATALSKAFDRLGSFDRALLFRHAYNVATVHL
jgi:hypothetical protein